MEYILVIAAIYNLIGALAMWFQNMPLLNTTNELSSEYMQYRLFTGGTAFIFSIMYLYVFFVPALAVPILLFGIALKLWSFVSCLICYKKYNLPKADFIKVGLGNLVFALLFILYLLLRSH